MRILDQDTNKATKNVLLLLTQSEAAELRDDLNRMLSLNRESDHSHISDLEYEHEITVAIYGNDKINSFDERTKMLIENDR
jgi:hypothetical protein